MNRQSECWKKHPEKRPQSQSEPSQWMIRRPANKDDDDEVAGIVLDNEIHLGLIDIAVDEFAITKVAGVAIKQEDLSLSDDDQFSDEEGDRNKKRADTRSAIKTEESDLDSPRSPNNDSEGQEQADNDAKKQENASDDDSCQSSKFYEYVKDIPEDEERKKFDKMFDKFPHEHEKVQKWAPKTDGRVKECMRRIQDHSKVNAWTTDNLRDYMTATDEEIQQCIEQEERSFVTSSGFGFETRGI